MAKITIKDLNIRRAEIIRRIISINEQIDLELSRISERVDDLLGAANSQIKVTKQIAKFKL